ncbi:hypothetical protein B0H66DRAFT_594047 [Apodospora peruviana]|uniref:MEI5 protein n=1 Tax=Apodospora peruviana TaxID=516989 RepID=A0AAE0HZ51_9PEZI|nr:hypothetical protein B0H66DRAFT_594047 [Apodospora peruviana]
MSSQVDHASVVTELFANISNHDSFKYIKTVLDDNTKLKEEIGKVHVANDVNHGRISRLMTDLETLRTQSQDKDDKLSAQANERAELLEQLRVQDTKLKESARHLSKVRTTLEKDLHLAIKQQAEQANEIQRLGNFAVKIIPINIDDISARLSTLFTSALILAESYFAIDFPLAMLSSDTQIWDPLKIRTTKLAKPSGAFPLLLKNSWIAKRMRVAAFLLTLASELDQHIFQPSYLLEHGHELSSFLSDLAEADSERESYLRSVLLASLSAERQTKMVTRRVNLVVQNVIDCVGNLFPRTKQTEFRTELSKFVETACQLWGHIQQLQDRVEASFDVWHEEARWRVLPESSTSMSTANAGDESPPKMNGIGGKSNGESSKPAQSGVQRSTTDKGGDISDFRDIAAVVWPFFFVDDLEEVISPGYVLCEAEVKATREEEKEQMVAGARRAARQRERKFRAMPTVAVAADRENHGEVQGEKVFQKGGGGQRSG